MKLEELLDEVKKEIEEEDAEKVKGLIKTRLKEIRDLKRLLTKAEAKLNKLLEKDTTDVADELWD